MIYHYPHKRAKQQACQLGVTLLELMITLAIAAILVTLVAPSVQTIVASNRIAAQINDTSAAIQFARYQAIDKQTTAIICPSSDFSSCNNANWNLAKIVFIDANLNNQRDANEDLLYSTQEVVGDLVFTGPANTVGFVESGASLNANASFIKLCPSDRNVKFARALNINQQGRVRLSRDSDNDDIHEDISGTALSCT
ncbi:GspH/FimT family pseudopilin [Agaribacter flavus]|uniref:Type II secretion system protein H n=1 Tax=Agaribacter flavus TaxID=1902781 RepID=A0ABV7FPU7_9ALTE